MEAGSGAGYVRLDYLCTRLPSVSLFVCVHVCVSFACILSVRVALKVHLYMHFFADVWEKLFCLIIRFQCDVHALLRVCIFVIAQRVHCSFVRLVKKCKGIQAKNKGKRKTRAKKMKPVKCMDQPSDKSLHKQVNLQCGCVLWLLTCLFTTLLCFEQGCVCLMQPVPMSIFCRSALAVQDVEEAAGLVEVLHLSLFESCTTFTYNCNHSLQLLSWPCGWHGCFA